MLPLLLRHVGVRPGGVTILTKADRADVAAAAAARHGARLVVATLDADNYGAVLGPLLKQGDFCVNLTTDVCSLSVLELCAQLGVLYIDTVVEPWAGWYTDASVCLGERTNYALREKALSLRSKLGAAPSRFGGRGPTALIAHGANPGLVSHLVKAALLTVASARANARPSSAFDPRDPLDAGGGGVVEPTTAAGWSALAASLGVKVIHVSERDTTVASSPRRPGEFVNTWSVDGFISEACQPAELGWGTHEGRPHPAGGAAHASGCGAAVFLSQPGLATKVRSWAPSCGPFHGFCVTHHEAISIADWLTLRDPTTGDVTYRPTVHYAYRPCDDALASLHDLGGSELAAPESKRLLEAGAVAGGSDELGVLLGGWDAPSTGLPGPAFWLGSSLSCSDAAQRCEANTATSLQVAATVLGGVVWALEHPLEGIVEPEELGGGASGWRRVLAVARPYIEPVAGVWAQWTPLAGRAAASKLFPAAGAARGGDDEAAADPWRFANVRV